MKKFSKSISFLFLVVFIFFIIGAYFSGSIFDALNILNKNIKNFGKAELGSLIKQVKGKVINPPPFKIDNSFRNVILKSSEIFLETNRQRNLNGLPALPGNEILNKAALAKANDMAKNQYFDHTSPFGVEPFMLVKGFGYDYITTGENLILGNFDSEREVVEAWMQSIGHRENILNKRYTEIGVAIVLGTYNGQIVWFGVQEFGLPLSFCKQPEASQKNQIDILKNKLNDLSFQIDQKKQYLESNNYERQEYNSLVREYNQLVSQYEDAAQDLKNLIEKYNSDVILFNQCVGNGN